MRVFSPRLTVPTRARRKSAWRCAAAMMLALLFAPACDSSGPGGNAASNEAPQASFTISNGSPRAGEQVTLSASGSTDPDGQISSYLWDFGADGGSEETGRQVTWRFDSTGTAGVQLTVTDSDGASETARREADVQPGVEAAFTYAPEEPRAGEEVTFDASGSSEPLGEIETYAWDFDGDDETDATGETATHTFDYERGDSASVSLKVVGEDNVQGIADRELALRPLQIALRVEQARITQAVQRYDTDRTPVPLVAGREGLLRVFLSAGQDNPYSPEVQVQLFHGGGAPVETLTATSERTVPTSPQAGALTQTWNIRVPGELIQPGLSMRVEANPGGDIPLVEESRAQFPEGEALVLDVREVPPLRLTMIPVKVAATGETGNVTEDNIETYLEQPRDLFPISEYDVVLHDTYTTSAAPGERFTVDLLNEIDALRVAEGSSRYYYGAFEANVDADAGGRGFRPGKAAVGIEESSSTLAHELGHNFNRMHAPCGNPDFLDPSYPYPNARIGAYGFELDEETLRPRDRKDLMSYCGPEWISGYTYTGILNYRQTNDRPAAARRFASRAPADGGNEPVLLVWGNVTEGGEATLEPAFQIEAPPVLPVEDGPYTLEGFDAQGGKLFSFSFAGKKVADGPAGGRSFAFAIPQSRTGGDRLARLEVSGPQGASAAVRSQAAQAGGPAQQPLSQSAGGFSLRSAGRGKARLRWSSASYRAVMVRDADTGEVLSIARGGEARLRAEDVGAVDLLFSDGVRTRVVRRARVR